MLLPPSLITWLIAHGRPAAVVASTEPMPYAVAPASVVNAPPSTTLVPSGVSVIAVT